MEKEKILLFIFLCSFFVYVHTDKYHLIKINGYKEKNRYYMTDSLIEKLNEEKPKKTEIFDFLGKPKLAGRISDNAISYWLKSAHKIGRRRC